MRKLILGMVMVMMTACASLGLAPADTFSKKLAYQYGNLQGVYETVANGVTAGVISKEDGKAVIGIADNAKFLLDSSRIVYTQTGVGDEAKLRFAIAALTAAQTYINTHRKP